MTAIVPVSLIGALLVATVMAAPLASDATDGNLDQEDSHVDRAKRAEEQIYFGNQQNKARTLEKKSDNLNNLRYLLTDQDTPGEVDQGGDVIAHQQVPIQADLQDREQAAMEGGDKGYAQAMESAMESAVQKVIEDESASDGHGSDDSTDGDGSEEEQTVEEEKAPESAVESEEQEEELANGMENGVQQEENSDLGDTTTEDENGENEAVEDDEESDLQAAAENMSSGPEGELDDVTSGIAAEDTAETGAEPEEQDTSEDTSEVSLEQLSGQPVEEQPAYETQYQGEPEVNSAQQPVEMPPIYGDGDKNMFYRLLMASPYERNAAYQNYLNGRYPYFRRRRSSLATPHGNKNRRIKRDLLDDQYGIPYSQYLSQYQPEVAPSYSRPDESSLSEEEVEYMYKLFLDFLEENYANQIASQNPYEMQEEESLGPEYIPEEEEEESKEDEDDEQYMPNEIVSPYNIGYAYEPEDAEPYPQEAKRSMEDFYREYYPEPVDKRYFFPFNEEPETHWGAFVPEKRADYGESIQRLQRLAMALSDNREPYYRGLLERKRR